MKIHDHEFKVHIKEEEIQARVSEIATQINKDYKGSCPLFIPVLNGAFIFASDLLKQVKLDCNISFIKIASYSKMESSGNLKELIGINENIFKRDVVIIEDIVDSGLTISNLMEKLGSLGPSSIELATLLVKRDNLEADLDIKYVGFDIPNDFVIGYGLDYDGLGRNLKDIYIKK